MTDQDRIAELEARVKHLEARVHDLFEALKFESTNTTRHLGLVREDMTEIHEYLMPALHTLFPGIAEDHQTIATITRRRPSSDTKEN